MLKPLQAKGFKEKHAEMQYRRGFENNIPLFFEWQNVK